MKCLARLAPFCFLTIASYAQQTISLPIIVEGASQSSLPIQAANVKVEVNHEPVPVASATSLSDKHLQYVLINDARVHVKWPGGTDQQAQVAKELLKQVITPGSDIGTLINYGDGVFLDVENERDPKKLSSKIAADATSPTRLYDAIVTGVQRFAKQPASPDGRKVIFLVCDAMESESHVSLEDAVKALQKASLPIFVFVPSHLEKKKEGQSMRELAENSGGRVYFLPPNTKHLKFDSLKSDLADSFLLTLSLTSQKGLVPLSIAEPGSPQTPIHYPRQVFVP